MKWLVLLVLFGASFTRLALAGRREELLLCGGVVALLAVFLAVGVARRGTSTGRDILVRTETWCWMIGLFLLALALHLALVFGLLAFLSFVALREYFSLLPMYQRGTVLRAEDRPAIALAYLAIPLTYFVAYEGWYGLYIIFIPVFMTLGLPLALVATNNPQGLLHALGAIVSGLMLFVFLFSHGALLAALHPFLLLYALLVTEIRDVLAYCFGKALAPLPWRWVHAAVAPRINPRKTWVGAGLAALGCAAVSAALAPLLPVLPGGRPGPGFLFGLGLAVGAFGLVGDLATGAIKRDLQVKDTSHSLPGHGGVIDRINGVIFTAPLIFHLVWFAYYPGRIRLE